MPDFGRLPVNRLLVVNKAIVNKHKSKHWRLNQWRQLQFFHDCVCQQLSWKQPVVHETETPVQLEVQSAKYINVQCTYIMHPSANIKMFQLRNTLPRQTATFQIHLFSNSVTRSLLGWVRIHSYKLHNLSYTELSNSHFSTKKQTLDKYIINNTRKSHDA